MYSLYVHACTCVIVGTAICDLWKVDGVVPGIGKAVVSNCDTGAEYVSSDEEEEEAEMKNVEAGRWT